MFSDFVAAIYFPEHLSLNHVQCGNLIVITERLYISLICQDMQIIHSLGQVKGRYYHIIFSWAFDKDYCWKILSIFNVSTVFLQTLDESPVDADAVERGFSLNADPTGLPRIHGLPSSSIYTTSGGSTESCTASPKNPRSRESSHSGEPKLFASSVQLLA